ncbi:MAG: hypothetical protein QXX12_05580 [Nanopusillaceae archaeon]
MSETILRDRYGRIIGKIKVKSDGTEELRDRYGKYLGKYDPKKNETRDRYGRLIGKGNLLPLLLAKEAHK